MKESFDIAIIGAGPAGCSAALTLRNSQCSIALFEKSQFPRNKICGDGICDRSINTLKTISPEYYTEFVEQLQPMCIENTEIVYKNRSYIVNLKNFGYTCKRYNFDAFLFSLVERDCKNISIFQNCGIRSVSRMANGIKLIAENGQEFTTKMLLVCNGALSKIARDLTNTHYEEKRTGVAIRAYYKNVAELKPNTIELHYNKEYFPGYLWIFPMADGSANVGFGCRVKKNESLRSIFEDWIANDQNLKKRFAQSERITSLQGGMVPYNYDKFDCYGDNFVVCGDAANLIDPISGGGIGSAMLSGYFAALQADDCVKTNEFSKKETEKYAQRLQRRVQKEMHTRYKLQVLISKYVWLLDVLAFLGRQTLLFNKIKKWYLK